MSSLIVTKENYFKGQQPIEVLCHDRQTYKKDKERRTQWIRNVNKFMKEIK